VKRRQTNRYSTLAMINVTNLVDISLCLLVIFILTAPLIKEGVDVETPVVGSAEKLADLSYPIVVTVGDKREIYLNDELCSEEDIGMRVRSEYDQDESRAVLLKADKSLEYGYVMGVMDKIRTAGIKTVTLVTKPPRNPEETDSKS